MAERAADLTSPQRDLAFTQLYRALYPSLVRLAFLVVDENDLAEEVVQDAFARLHPRWDRVAEPAGYVRRSVINACRDVLRRRRVERAVLGRVRPRDDEPEFDYIGDALAHLPPREHIALVLRHYEGLSESQIATAMGCPVGTVKTLLHRGGARLKGQLPS